MSEEPLPKKARLTKPGVPYIDVKNDMRTFDLLFFRGTDVVSNAISRIQKQKTGCGDFTHVGIVIRGTDLMPAKEGEDAWLKPDILYVFESTMSGNMADGCTDVHGESHLGVQLRRLDDVVTAYDAPPKSRLAWCALLESKRISDDTERAIACRNIYEKYRGLRYDLSAVDLSACAFPQMRRLRDSKAFTRVRDMLSKAVYSSKRASNASGDDNDLISRWQFCSELAANIYREIGALDQAVEPQNVMPIDFLPKKVGDETYDADKQVPVIVSQVQRFYA